MDWANRFTIGGFTVSYCTLNQMWEVIERMEALEVSHRWFTSRKHAEAFCLSQLTQAKARIYNRQANKLQNRAN
nr:hypothetical protein [uncultured Mediterranean phage uvMED]